MGMVINWSAVATIAAPIIALFVGVWINRRFESRAVLISYFGHVAVFRTTPPSGTPVFIHTHAVVLRNVGRRSATNVRLRHTVLPDFIIWPEPQHHTENLPSGGREIVIPTLVPGQQVTVSYLYSLRSRLTKSILAFNPTKALRVRFRFSFSVCIQSGST
jgi:hypothetical protein